MEINEQAQLFEDCKAFVLLIGCHDYASPEAKDLCERINPKPEAELISLLSEFSDLYIKIQAAGLSSEALLDLMNLEQNK